MKGYISKLDRAHRITKGYGYKEDEFGYWNVVKQIFAKLIVNGRTISRNLDTGKLTVHPFKTQSL